MHAYLSIITIRPFLFFVTKLLVVACAVNLLLCQAVANAQPSRQEYLETKPLAEVQVQALATPKQDEYENINPLMMVQPLEEDPLSFYVRTQDGEWHIPARVNAEDPWVRLLVLGPKRPVIMDVAIEINQRPFRAAREQWIDKLLTEAKATFLVRTGEAVADAAGIEPPTEANYESEPAEASLDAGKSTKGADDESENEAGEAAISEDDPQVPMVAAQSRQASSLFKRLINYLAADQSGADREEVRWLLAEWTGGPSQLTLSPAFAWRRAAAAPVWDALDLDSDDVLSAEEIDNCASSLKQADVNRDEIVSLDELDRHGNKKTGRRQAKGYPLAVVIDGQTDWNTLRQHLVSAYAKQPGVMVGSHLLERITAGDESIEAADLVELVSLSANLVYRVAFANEGAVLQLLATGDSSSSVSDASWDLQSATEQTITIACNESYMELTAAQGPIDEENASGDMQQTQIAIGAVVDGYPLLRLLDLDDDQQLSQRERNGIADLLKTFDHNRDGQVESLELPTPIRLTVTHGPFAHQQLARATSAQRVHEGGFEAPGEVPAWFVGMDRNHDGDLSRREFQGSPSQFAKFDQDGDGLVSRAEIIAAETKN